MEVDGKGSFERKAVFIHESDGRNKWLPSLFIWRIV
jgi:hypothetical protein